MTKYIMPDDDIVAITRDLTGPLRKTLGPQRLADLIGKTWRSMKAYCTPADQKGFRRIAPDDLRTLYHALSDDRYRCHLQHTPFTVRLLNNAKPSLPQPLVFDVLDVFGERVRSYMKLHLALEYADRIGGSVREMTGRPVPQLTEDQSLRNRWRVAMGTCPEVNTETAFQVAECCPYTLVRMGLEDDLWGITLTPEQVHALEVALGSIAMRRQPDASSQQTTTCSHEYEKAHTGEDGKSGGTFCAAFGAAG